MLRRIIIGRVFSISLILASLSVLLAASSASAYSPRVNRILPGGIQRGTTGTMIFEGERLHDSLEILFYDPGFEVLEIEPIEDYVMPPDETYQGDAAKKRAEMEFQAVRATVRVADDCRLGEHLAHMRTAGGVSEYRTFFVESMPGIHEQEPNNDLASAQAIDMNVVVAGVIPNGDEDCFAVEVKKGQRLSVEVVAMRLATHMFDAHIAVFDSAGKEIASAAGSAFGVQDGIISLIVPKDDRYIVKVREDTGAGTSMSTYRLHVGTFPRPTALFPAGGKMGESVTVRCIGDVTGDYDQAFDLPSTFDVDFTLSPHDEDAKYGGGTVPTPIPFRLFEHGNAFEQEPNDSLAQASPVKLPLAFNGVIEKPGDVDYFRFTAKKGQSLEVECYAQRVRSELDPVMQLFDASGKKILENDDGGKITENADAQVRGADSYFRFNVPEDGEYVLRINDLMDRGGKTFVYRVEFSPVKPWLLVRLPRAEDPNDLYGQYRQQIFVARGNYYGCVLGARRRDYRGPVILEAPDMPEGVSMHTMTMPGGGGNIPVVFKAEKDAPLGGSLVSMYGRDPDPKMKNLHGAFRNQADLLRGRPGLALLKIKAVDRIPIVVTEEIPFRLEFKKPNITLLRGGNLDLKVHVHRDEGFTDEITLTMPFLPRNVGTSARVKVAGDQTEAIFPLSAKTNTAPLPWKLFVLGSSGERDLMWASTPALPIQISRRFVTAELREVTAKQGQPAKVFATLKQLTPFEGNATAKLSGLPSGVSATPVEFTAAAKEIVFDLTIDPTSPVGKHESLTCNVTVEKDGEKLTAVAGKGQLRIDAAVEAAEAPVVAEADAKDSGEGKVDAGGGKVLSRLERLREEAKQRAEERRKRARQSKLP